MAAGVKATVTDANVTRYRPMLIVAESAATQEQAEKRIKWERSTRSGGAVAADYTLAGWGQLGPNGGRLWRVNELVRVDDDAAHIHDTFLVAEASFEIGDQGQIAKLHLGLPDAFAPDQSQDITSGNGVGYWTTEPPDGPKSPKVKKAGKQAGGKRR
jgi:prophage tail gpP-like protein